MFSFSRSQSDTSILKTRLKPYTISFSLDKITPGVDNVRYDVCLSPELCKTAGDLVLRLVSEHAKADEILRMDNRAKTKELNLFRKLCHDVLLDAVHRAKAGQQMQIDYLAQIAVAKMVIKTIHDQYEIFIERLKNSLWRKESSYSASHTQTINLKEKISRIQRDRKRILHKVGNEIFNSIASIQRKNLQKLREANFGTNAPLPLNVISNPMLCVVETAEDHFIIEEYDILLGHRFEDPNKYDLLLQSIRDFLEAAFQNIDKETEDTTDKDTIESAKPGDLLSDPHNIDILFNYFQSETRSKNLKKRDGSKDKILNLREQAAEQKKLLNLLLKRFNKAGLTHIIVSFYEMKTVYEQYCPPLTPQQIVQFLTTPRSRKTIENQLNRLKAFYGRDISLKPLYKLIKEVEKVSTGEKKKLLIRFLKGLSRYHRDYQNLILLKDNMDKINLTVEDKIINLSRANKTLYDFMLPEEHVIEESTIINHVIVKADVRGSTGITHQLKERGLNSASHFSLNFFDPISEILPEYGANKAFIEGDAVILSLFEHDEKLGARYSVSRACGIAIQILYILRRHNLKSRASRLPILEVGIGINYLRGAPTFLFDGDKRIMISPAINLADRMSGCSKFIRKQMSAKKAPFNLYVFQPMGDEEIAKSSDDLFVRYNVNGIELNREGFKKLSEEIELKAIECRIPEITTEKINIYAGKFPTSSGKYQKLIIREAVIPEVSPDDLTIIRMTSQKYYEVCTHPRVYEYVKMTAS